MSSIHETLWSQKGGGLLDESFDKEDFFSFRSTSHTSCTEPTSETSVESLQVAKQKKPMQSGSYPRISTSLDLHELLEEAVCRGLDTKTLPKTKDDLLEYLVDGSIHLQATEAWKEVERIKSMMTKECHDLQKQSMTNIVIEKAETRQAQQSSSRSLKRWEIEHQSIHQRVDMMKMYLIEEKKVMRQVEIRKQQCLHFHLYPRVHSHPLAKTDGLMLNGRRRIDTATCSVCTKGHCYLTSEKSGFDICQSCWFFLNMGGEKPKEEEEEEDSSLKQLAQAAEAKAEEEEKCVESQIEEEKEKGILNFLNSQIMSSESDMFEDTNDSTTDDGAEATTSPAVAAVVDKVAVRDFNALASISEIPDDFPEDDSEEVEKTTVVDDATTHEDSSMVEISTKEEEKPLTESASPSGSQSDAPSDSPSSRPSGSLSVTPSAAPTGKPSISPISELDVSHDEESVVKESEVASVVTATTHDSPEDNSSSSEEVETTTVDDNTHEDSSKIEISTTEEEKPLAELAVSHDESVVEDKSEIARVVTASDDVDGIASAGAARERKMEKKQGSARVLLLKKKKDDRKQRRSIRKSMRKEESLQAVVEDKESSSGTTSEGGEECPPATICDGKELLTDTEATVVKHGSARALLAKNKEIKKIRSKRKMRASNASVSPTSVPQEAPFIQQ